MGRNNFGSRLVRRGVGGLAGAGLLAGGIFYAVTEPAAPEPAPGEKQVGEWPASRLFIPAKLNKLIDRAVGKEHSDDLTLTARLYRDRQVGNYAVASYNLFGESQITGTFVCLPGDTVDTASDGSGGLKLYIEKEGSEHFGRVFKGQTFVYDNDAALRVCADGLTAKDYKMIGKALAPR